MHRFISFILFICICFLLNAQEIKVAEKDSIDEPVFMIVEDNPSYPGGENAMIAYISNHIVYPQIEKTGGIQGMVIVSFIVEKDGSLSNIHILKGVSPALDEEAMRVIKSMPNWKPGKQRGKEVRVSINLPIRFSLD